MSNLSTSSIDPNALAAIGDLHLIARMVVAGLGGGLHRGLQTGASAEFAQYRPYSQGDDTRLVDWRLYGRTDRLHIKEHQAETGVHCTIVLDCSASMDYGSGSVDKFTYGRMLAACLVTLMQSQRDQVGFVAYHSEICAYVPAAGKINQARRILVELASLQPAGPTQTEQALCFIGNALPPRGMVVLISDLLHPIDATLAQLRSLRARRHEVLVLQISDPTEQDFPFENALTLIDAEAEEERFTVPDDVRQAYLDNRAHHFSQIRRVCLAAEIDIEEFTCTEPLDRALHRFLHRRHHGLRTSSRRQSRNITAKS